LEYTNYSGIPEFIKSISSNNLADDVSKHFDKVIALRHLVGIRDGVEISTMMQDNKFGFSISVSNVEIADRIKTSTDNRLIHCFGAKMVCHTTISSPNSLSLFISKN